MKNSSAGAKRVLVVEDEPAISTVCRRVLTGEGFEVDIAVQGKVAQDVLGKGLRPLPDRHQATGIEWARTLSMVERETPKTNK